LALLMGVFTKDNRVAEFLKFSRSMLQADHAVLVFQNEPYIWFSSADGCKPFLASGQAQLEPYFEGADCIDDSHPNYSNFSQHIQRLGAGHTRLLAFNLTDDELPIGRKY